MQWHQMYDMRTTLDIEDDVLQAVKELAQRDGSTAGRVLSTLARRGLAAQVPAKGQTRRRRGGVPVLPTRGEVITLEKVRKIMDEEGV
ncbi:MAG TPA: hypothetical protein VH598_16005 [Verrucomicrobiae bacterium]|jgi:hypothetical protein|nr:hypothetical protein [Verrucomicrobiae bacterium]